MKSKMLFDRTKRMLVAEHEVERIALRYVARNHGGPVNARSRMIAQLALAEQPAAYSVHRIARRCTETGRARAVFREFNVGRHIFRNLALEGCLHGVTKAAW